MDDNKTKQASDKVKKWLEGGASAWGYPESQIRHLAEVAPELLAAAEAMCAHLEDIGMAGSLAFAADPIATARYEALFNATKKARGE